MRNAKFGVRSEQRRISLQLNLRLAEGYKSPSQRARRLTEGWFAENMYCAACPNDRLERTRGSTEVVDFCVGGAGLNIR